MPSRYPLIRAALPDAAGEQAGRTHEQDEQQQPVDGDVDKIGAEIANRHHLDQADDQAAGDRAPDIAHAADDHGGDALEPDHLAHERMDLAVVQREDHAGERGEQSAHHEYHRHDAVDVDAEQERGVGIFRNRAQAATERGCARAAASTPRSRRSTQIRPTSCGRLMTRPPIAPVGIAEQCRHGAQLGAPIDRSPNARTAAERPSSSPAARNARPCASSAR